MTNGQDFNGTQRERKAFSCRSGFIVKRKVEYMDVASFAISFLCIFSQALSARWYNIKNNFMSYSMHTSFSILLMNLFRVLLKCYKMLRNLHDNKRSFLESMTTVESKSKKINVNFKWKVHLTKTSKIG